MINMKVVRVLLALGCIMVAGHAYAAGSKQNLKEVEPAVKEEAVKFELKANDRVLGNANAPVTIVEYASLTCSHCADFYADTMQLIKKDYIATGKVRFVYRDFPLDRMSLDAAVMARCADKERYFGLLQILFKNQANWAGSPDYLKSLRQIGAIAGLPPEKFQACMADEGLRKSIAQSRIDGQKDYGISSTPTFILIGKEGQETLSGNQPYKVFKESLERLGAKK